MVDDAEDHDYVDVVERIWQHARRRPDAVALRCDGSTWTYDDLVRSASERASQFRGHGLGHGDRALLVAPTSVGFVQAYLAILAVGAVAVTVNPLCTVRELAYFAEDSQCRLVIGWPGDDAQARDGAAAAEVAGQAGLLYIGLDDLPPGSDHAPLDPVARSADEPAVLLYTSGTTGRPKGAMITLGNIFASTRGLRGIFHTTSDDRIGTALPLFHVYGQVSVLAGALDSGASVSLLTRFTGAGALRLVEQDALTILCGVPTMWIEMLEAARTMQPLPDVTSLRLAASGGAALPLEANRVFAATFGASVFDGYGLTETTATATCHPLGREPREGSVGRAIPGVEVTVVSPAGDVLPAGTVGEIAVSGRNVMLGYWRRTDATNEVLDDGRLLTGDLGRLDDDGFLWIVGRIKELIIRGGYNVYPAEIEDALYEHPAVLEAAVVGLPDERLGEEVAAVIALREGMPATPPELRAWLDTRVAAYKVPRVYQIVSALPKGATGKIQKTAIDRRALSEDGTRTRRS